MGWSYNQIDVYLSDSPNLLEETAIGPTWTQVSTYGLLRDRPTITPSVNNSDKIVIPGRPGELYSTVEKRSNAQFSFEVLVADAWPFASLKASSDQWLNNVYNRATYLKSFIETAKRVSYKEPGKQAIDYFEVLNTKCDITDSDEKVMLLKVTMDIYPFRYYFDGNARIQLAVGVPYEWRANDTPNFSRPFSTCCPIFVTEPFTNGQYAFHIGLGSYPYDGYEGPESFVDVNPARVTEWATAIAGKSLTIDTGKMLAYDNTGAPMNKYLTGDYAGLRPQGCSFKVRAGNNSSVVVNMYTRRGINI